MAEIILVTALSGAGAVLALAVALRHTWHIELLRHQQRPRQD